MKVLLLGGSGFIGRAVKQALLSAGHEVKALGRGQIDFAALKPDMASHFAGMEAVVNCVGVMSLDAAFLEQVHHLAPLQLAQWAQAQGVRRWLQLSALGADAAQDIAFVGSKGRGDAALATSSIHTLIARPSLVYGRDSINTRHFLRLARLPVIPLPEGGCFRLQPVHVQEVAEGMKVMLTADVSSGSIIHMTGAQEVSLAEYLNLLRRNFYGKKAATIVNVPLTLMQPFLPLAAHLSKGFISRDNMTLLEQGACADNQTFAALLGRTPLGVSDFF